MTAVFYTLREWSAEGWLSLLWRYGPARDLCAPSSLNSNGVGATVGPASYLYLLRYTTDAPTLSHPEDCSAFDPAPSDCDDEGVCRCGCGERAWPPEPAHPRRPHPRDGTEEWPLGDGARVGPAPADAAAEAPRELIDASWYRQLWKAATGFEPAGSLNVYSLREAIDLLREERDDATTRLEAGRKYLASLDHASNCATEDDEAEVACTCPLGPLMAMLVSPIPVKFRALASARASAAILREELEARDDALRASGAEFDALRQRAEKAEAQRKLLEHRLRFGEWSGEYDLGLTADDVRMLDWGADCSCDGIHCAEARRESAERSRGG